MTIERKLTKTTAAGASEAVYVEDVFSTWLYTGNGSSQTITNGIDLATKGGLVWLKDRSGATFPAHCLFDTSRGSGKVIRTHTTGAESSNFLQSFLSTGFSLGGDNLTNQEFQPFVSWTFRKQPKFFDIVTYTGNGAASQTIMHNLGSSPGFIITKATSTTSDWWCYHRSIGNNGGIRLNGTSGVSDFLSNSWNVTSTSFNAINYAGNNTSGQTYVAYLFAHDAGGFGAAGTDSVVSCGSFSSDGTVNLGWEPQYLLFKRTDSTSNWRILDNMRGMPVISSSTGSQQVLLANSSVAESVDGLIAPTATGFTTFLGAGTYIYLAIRRGPMKTPTDATKVFATQLTAGETNGTPSMNRYTSNFAVDFFIEGARPGTTSAVRDRLRGGNITSFVTASSEINTDTFKFDDMDGVYLSSSFSANTNRLAWMFRRAPGFFDVVCYTGDGNTGQRLINHGLKATPEILIVKARSGASNWRVAWTGGLDLLLNSSAASPQNAGGDIYWTGDTFFATDGRFSSNDVSQINVSGTTYVAYLFASCPGVSKVGSYTGNGSSQTINCGFTNGARFVLIKRTDSTGDWWVYDSARGIVSANDPALRLNSTAAEVTSADAVDPASSGFIVNQEATCNINVSSGNYIYLAIA